MRRELARPPSRASATAMTVGGAGFVVASCWTQVPDAPYLALGLVAVASLLALLAGLVTWWARR